MKEMVVKETNFFKRRGKDMEQKTWTAQPF